MSKASIHTNLIRQSAFLADVSIVQAKQIISNYLEGLLGASLETPVRVPDFGTFTPRKHKGGPKTLPTGKVIEIPEMRTAGFRPASTFKVRA